MSLSVVIPTYNNTEFLVELFDSIEKNNSTFEFEVLIGIDNCVKTLEYILKNKFPKNIRFFYFTQNYGPYVIKNTLAKISKNEKLFFFDSDDVLKSNSLNEIKNLLDKFDLVKPKYINFKDIEGNRVFEKTAFGEGVFGIKKNKFFDVNGFEPWRVAADSDLMGRLYKTRISLSHTKDILFDRRLHSQSLTIHPDTNYSSQIRTRYHLISRKKTKEDIVLKEYIIGEYQEIFQNSKFEFTNDGYEISDEVLDSIKSKEEKAKKLIGIFDKLPKKMADNSKPKSIDYDRVNFINSNQTLGRMNNALKKAKLENIQKKSRR
jgi:glycosyltransferase involved in cell wall biosynthesis